MADSIEQASRAKRPPRRYRRWIALAAAVLIVAGIVIGGAIPRGAGPARGQALSGQITTPTTRKTVLHVASFNIHSSVGTDGRMDLGRIANSVSGYDVIGLCETRGRALTRSESQVQTLGQRLGRMWLFAPAERQWWRESFGNGILSSLPAERWERIPLPHSFGRGYKNLLTTEIKAGGRAVRVLVTHIDRQADRERQMRFVFDRFRRIQTPAILMGDFNTRPDDALIKELLPRSDIIDAIGGRGGSGRIDWILVRGLRVRDAGVVESGASDHPLVWAEVGWP